MSTWLPVTRPATLRRLMLGVLAIAALVALVSPSPTVAQSRATSRGGLDCNGDSLIQQAQRITAECADIRGFAGTTNANTDDGRFYDNGHYIGHDEPDMTFLSNQPGSGNSVTWVETLPRDPAGRPTISKPGSDVTNWFELSPAPWFSMAICDPKSYPQGVPCTPESDANAPTCVGVQTTDCFPGGGSAFMEMQLYPPGFPPNDTGVGCDDSHWCGALNIDSLECTLGFATCNGDCIEPVNWAFISTNGVPAGPPSPQDQDVRTFTPDRHTLLMNPGDRIVVSMFDAPVPGGRGARAFEVVIDDLTTHQHGWMQASAANGFMNTSIADCSGTPFNFEPEFNTAAKGNIPGWTALQTNISTQFEIGHFEPCTSITGGPVPLTPPLAPTGLTDSTWTFCHGPYEDTAPGGDGGQDTAEPNDVPCYPAGDTHGALHTDPDLITGCLDFASGGDLDFEGTSYWADWPVAANPTRTVPGSFVQSLPTTRGRQYPAFFIQTDVALSESTCAESPAGCAVPPPNGPGQFYPYWSRTRGPGSDCAILFGNVSARPRVTDFGKDAQYGTDQAPTLGYDEFEGPVMSNRCGDERR